MKDAKGMKAIDSKETNRAFSIKITIEIWPKKNENWAWQRHRTCWRVWNVCSAEDIVLLYNEWD